MAKFDNVQAVKIISGDYETLAGEVLERDDEKDNIKVRIFGLFKDEPIDETRWFKFDEVEAL